MRLMLWRATGDEPVHVICSTEHWVGDLQPLVEEPFNAGNYIEAHIGKTHFADKGDAVAAMIVFREAALKAADAKEKTLKEELKELRARTADTEKALEALIKLRGNA